MRQSLTSPVKISSQEQLSIYLASLQAIVSFYLNDSPSRWVLLLPPGSLSDETEAGCREMTWPMCTSEWQSLGRKRHRARSHLQAWGKAVSREPGSPVPPRGLGGTLGHHVKCADNVCLSCVVGVKARGHELWTLKERQACVPTRIVAR